MSEMFDGTADQTPGPTPEFLELLAQRRAERAVRRKKVPTCVCVPYWSEGHPDHICTCDRRSS